MIKTSDLYKSSPVYPCTEDKLAKRKCVMYQVFSLCCRVEHFDMGSSQDSLASGASLKWPFIEMFWYLCIGFIFLPWRLPLGFYSPQLSALII